MRRKIQRHGREEPKASPDALLRWLLARGLVSRAALENGDVRVRARSSRHLGYRVEIGRGGFFVKQALDGRAARELQREAAAYARLAAAGVRVAPSLTAWDPATARLALRLVPEATSLTERLATMATPPSTLARELGAALARLHRVDAGTYGRGLAAGAARIAGLPAAARAKAEGSPAQRALLEALRSAPDFMAPVEPWLRERVERVFAHGDVRGENVLVPRRAAGAGSTLRLVDFERAGPGDPAWDLAGAYCAYLGPWVLETAGAEESGAAPTGAHAASSLARLRPSLAGLWSGYGARSTRASVTAFQRRVVVLTGLRLVQLAYEDAARRTRPSGATYFLLQLCGNVWRAPLRAAASLFAMDAA